MTKIKKIITASMAYALCAIALSSAQASKNLVNIATINIEKIQQESIMGKALNDQCTAKREKIQEELQSKMMKIQQKATALQNNSAALSKSAKDKQMAELQQEHSSVMAAGEKALYSINEVFSLSRQKMVETISQLSQKAASKKKIDLVMVSSAIVYVNDKTSEDITDEIMDMLNNKYKKVDYSKYLDEISI